MQSIGRRSHLVNLDPAAEPSDYEFTIDIRDLISLDDVMDELEYGPNGGLVYCFEFLLQNLDWLDDEIGDYDDEYLIFDCPGQIELYTHIPVLPAIVRHLQKSQNMSLCIVYLLESTFVTDRSKFFSGVLSAMSAMLLLETPHINVLSKMDMITNPKSTNTIVSTEQKEILKQGRENEKRRQQMREKNKSFRLTEGSVDDDDEFSVLPQGINPSATDIVSKRELKRYLNPDPLLLAEEADKSMKNPKFHALNSSIAQLIDEFGMVQFLPLNSRDPDSIATILSYVDDVTQWAEGQEPKEPADMDQEEDIDEIEELRDLRMNEE